MKYFFNEILINICNELKYMFEIFQLFLYAINISKKSRIIRNNKEYIHIYFYLSISKIYFFPNLTGSFSILRCIVGYLHRKIGQKSLLDKRILQYPFKNFCRSKYVEKQCLNIFFFSPPSVQFFSFFIEEIATPRRKLTEFAHTFLQERSRTDRQLPSTQLSPTNHQS